MLDALNLGNPGGTVAVVFSAPVGPATATNVVNYALNNGASILGARMGATPDTVLLQTAGLGLGTAYALTVTNVQDLSSPPNTIPAGSAITLEQNLHTWFRMDESAGTTLGDASGNNHYANVANGALLGYTGKILRAVKFDGVGGYGSAQPAYAGFSTNGLTVALWAYPTSLASWSRFIDYGNGAGSDNILFARNGTSADLTFEVYTGNASGGKVTAPGALTLNEWQHLAAVMDATGQVILYRNGIPLVTNTTAVPSAITRVSNVLGRSNWSQDGYYQGKMDDVRLYNRPLSEDAIMALAAGSGPDDTNPSIPPVSVTVPTATTALKNTPPGVFTIARTGDTTNPLTVFYALSGTATNGTDYALLSRSAIIPAGTNAAQVLVTPYDHAFTDPQRTVVLTLLGSPNYTIADADSGTVTIVNNESTGAPQVMLDLPASLAQPVGLPLTLSVYAAGNQPISYQWQRNGANLSDSGLLSGSHSSSLTLAAAWPGDSGTYQLAMTNSDGWAVSRPCAVTLTRIQPNDGVAWTQNNGDGSSTHVPVVSNNAVTLTNGLGNETASLFLNYPQYIGAFVASFIYQDVGGGGADGAAFVLQNDSRGAAALGGGGGGLGYSGIAPSVALEFNIYSANDPGIAFRTNGITGAPYAPTLPLNVAGGNPIGVMVRYDGTSLWLTLTDAVAQAFFSTNYTTDLPSLLGANTAYVGITGADGGTASTQRISSFFFAGVPTLSLRVPVPGVFQLSWPASAAGLVLQNTSDLRSGTWTTVANPVSVVNGQNRVSISPLTAVQFYRLGLP